MLEGNTKGAILVVTYVGWYTPHTQAVGRKPAGYRLHQNLLNLRTKKTGTYNIDLEFSQILDLVKQLSRKEKLRLSKELEKEIIDVKLTSLLKAFKTDELDQDTIDREVEIVRAELYAKSKAK
jgi:hypothetical protein